MKVLHVETGKHLYGGALQVFYLIRGLQQNGVSNVLVCPRGSAVGEACRPFAEVVEVPVGGDVDPRIFFQLRRVIRNTKPDLLHAHSRRGADWWTGLAGKSMAVPAILTRRVDNPESPWLARCKHALYAEIVTISEGIGKVLRATGLSAEKLTLIHSAVDFERYHQERDRRWFEREFDLVQGEKVVAVVAQLIERKGHRYLIEAMPSILQAVPETRFIFFGQGRLDRELKELCQRQGVAGQVLFAGFRNDMEKILPCLDLLAHPALKEGLGVSLLQASAAGVPIVAANAGGIPEVVSDGNNGCLVPPGDSKALGAAITEYLNNGALRREHGAAGICLVREEFSIPQMVQKYLSLYEKVLGGLID